LAQRVVYGSSATSEPPFYRNTEDGVLSEFVVPWRWSDCL